MIEFILFIIQAIQWCLANGEGVYWWVMIVIAIATAPRKDEKEETTATEQVVSPEGKNHDDEPKSA
ncbi:hypothetical protein [Paenibacillus abyssi]|uniref:Uncharacterized protein n=1 Tax=Paenibacillus abyssi TaxID=1340531 RepID=A0A917G1G3_9BACL|nr:hypothetical protein [Paenibacillus abyssi]GGG17671.1 hypothetical protein GCM10010916_38140 [Paenibacillus abyssi]